MSEINQLHIDHTDGLRLSKMIDRAKTGADRSQIGQLLDIYRNYLILIAQGQINARMRLRVEASDVVQETFLEAHRDFPKFRGKTEGELLLQRNCCLNFFENRMVGL